MTYLALKQETLNATHDIKAAVTVAGPTDLLAWADERPEMISVYLDLIGRWPDESSYRARSAVFWPELINAPLLIQHGRSDARVSVAQSETLAGMLAREGKIFKLMTYPDDDHELSAHSGGYPEALAWLEHYIGRAGEDYSYDRHEQAIRDALQAWLRLAQ